MSLLSQFPFVHSDEPWLGGLSRSMMHHLSPATTEPFFDLISRYPHAIKILFHTLQIPFIALFGYHPFSLRLLSLIAGFAGVYAFYRLLRSRVSSDTALWGGLFLLFDIQFIYASHFARQEIMLFSLLILALYLFSRGEQRHDRRYFRLCALSIGISIGFHPNSFLISLPVGVFYLVRLAAARTRLDLGSRFRDTLEYIAILVACAALFVALSLAMDPQFFSHYASTGKNLGVAVPLYIKYFRFPDFYLKLFHGISGTYYTPDIRLQFYLFAAAAVLSLPAALVTKRHVQLIVSTLSGIVLLNLGTLLLGKYSQPSIILHFPLYYLLISALLDLLPRRRSAAGALLAAALLVSSGINIMQELHILPPRSATPHESYAEYEEKIHRFVSPDARVLANLNAQFAFDYGKLRDYRNLDRLDEEGLSFAGYIEKNRIEYILYPEEMDLIYRRRPVWNILYGNVAGYYEEMQRFLAENCTEVGSFTSPVYGMRITRYTGTQPWKVTVYRVTQRQ